MSVWDTYKNRITSHGDTPRDVVINRELHMLGKKLPNTLSYHTVTINDVSQRVAIINSDNLDEKIIYSTTKEAIKGGELVCWMDNHWLVVECDANSEIYTEAKLRQCNHLLKWIDTDGIIHEQWCIVEDGTKLRELVSVQRNLYVKISIELLENPKAHIATT